MQIEPLHPTDHMKIIEANITSAVHYLNINPYNEQVLKAKD